MPSLPFQLMATFWAEGEGRLHHYGFIACGKYTRKHIKGSVATKAVHICKALGLCLNEDLVSQIRGQYSSSTHSRGIGESLVSGMSWHIRIAIP